MLPSSPKTSGTTELDEFREQWKQEVHARNIKQPPDSPFTTPPSSPLLKPTTAAPIIRGGEQSQHHTRVPRLGSSSSSTQPPHEDTSNPASSSSSSALNVYLMAIDMERQGELGQALVYYRRAFKMDPEVDKLYHRQCLQNDTSTKNNHGALSSTTLLKSKERDPLVVAATADSPSEVAFLLGMQNDTRLYVANHLHHVMDPLDAMAIQFCQQQDMPYIPAVDYKPVSIAKLPGEVLVQVFSHVVLYASSSIANCAAVCKRFFVATRSPSLWRHACEHVFKTPGMSMAQSRRVQAEYVASLYQGQWLRMYMDRPRLHYDGVYISVCQYIRPGESDTAWTRPVHLVTYYRYLRFFPDGTMIKYLSTDEPAAVVRLMKKDFSRPTQVFRGKFQFLNHHTVEINMRDKGRPRDHFCMTLDIKTTRRGRHNKLAWSEYWSRKDDRDESTVYDLALMRPFIFSGVRSFRD